MRQGFIRVAAVTPKVTVADPAENAKKIVALAEDAAKNGAKIIVFPELCITAYSCGDLFLQETLLREAEKTALIAVAEQTKELNALLFLSVCRMNILENSTMWQPRSITGKSSDWCQRPAFRITVNFMMLRHFARGMKQVEEDTVFTGASSSDRKPIRSFAVTRCRSFVWRQRSVRDPVDTAAAGYRTCACGSECDRKSFGE